MNIIFGIWRPQGPPVTREELESMAAHTRRFAPDGEWLRTCGEIGFGVQAQYTHSRSRLDVQPTSDELGNLLIFDGRIDNYRDLLRDLDLAGEDTPDSEIVLCAYRRWGERCFARLVGDWALALWDSLTHTLHLGRDHAGTRLLHYSRHSDGTVVWATYLDSYLSTALLDELDPVYMASYLAMLPSYGRTPFRDIKAIPPGHLVETTEHSTISVQFWSPKHYEQGVLKSSDDYAAHFLHLLKQSVARRTGAGAPILAELSGGVDSSAIVCLSDLLQSLGESQFEKLETLSYFNDSDPDWNERPYFTLVEAKRGHRGIHIDASLYCSTFKRAMGNRSSYLYPGIEDNVLKRDYDLRSITLSGGHRSILSGIGGDEFTGGTLDPAVEVADLFARGRAFSAVSRSFRWCLDRRISLIDLLGQSATFLRDHRKSTHLEITVKSIPWLTEAGRRHCRLAVQELPFAFYKPFVTRPVDAEISDTWWLTLRTQPHLKPSAIYRYEYRYPYLDRDLLEFLLGLPLDQLSRPGRRRYAMRRALRGIIPEEILERRRKAFLLSSPLTHIRRLGPSLRPLTEASLLVEGGFVDATQIQRAMDGMFGGEDIRWWVLISRFAGLETWLQYRVQGARVEARNGDPVLAIGDAYEIPAQ